MKNISGINVTLKAAISLDGKIATEIGESKWITGKTARITSNAFRIKNDAILVGINTVLNDDPQLNVRGVKNGNSPIRIVLDSKARIPNKSRVFKNDGVPVIIITGNKANRKIWPELSELKIIQAPSERPEILWVLSELKKLEIKSLLVEGGSMIHASFLKSNCVNKIALFLAPKIIGGQDSLTWCGNLNIGYLKDVITTEILSINQIGEDWLIWAKIKKK